MRKQLSKSEIKDIVKETGYQISKKEPVVLEEKDGIKVLKRGDKAIFFYHKRLVPTLHLLLSEPILKEVTIDAGAVRFIAGGADVMRPGIVEINDDIKKGDYVVIKEQTHNKPIAVGLAKFDSEEIKTMQKGKVIETLHYVGDRIWNA